MPEATPKPRRPMFTLWPPVVPREEMCQRANACATQHPTWYQIRLVLCALGRVFTQAAALAAATILPFTFASIVSEAMTAHGVESPAVRLLLLAALYAAWLPFAASVVVAAARVVALRLKGQRGVRLAQEDAPRLFRTGEDMLARLEAGPVDGIVVTQEHAIELRRLPRLGVIGLSSNWLLLGLPAMESLSPQHFRALLAHELALLPTRNREFGGWAHGLRARLLALRAAAEKNAVKRGHWRRWPDALAVDLLKRVLVRLDPWTLPAARRHESEADGIAAAIAGREFAATALLRMSITRHAVVTAFREDCAEMAQALPEPPDDTFEGRADLAAGPITREQVNAWLRVELERKDDLSSSTPLLWDRIRMLGYALAGSHDFHTLMEQTQPDAGLGETAARYFLADTLEPARERLFREWRAEHAADWRQRFDTFEELRREAARWSGAAADPESDPQALWRTAVAIGNTRGWRAALPVAARILELDRDHTDANLLTGQCLLEDGDETGLAHLDRAMEVDPAAVKAACTAAARFLESRDRKEEARHYRARWEEHQEAEQAAAEERHHARAADSYRAANASPEMREAIHRALEPLGDQIEAVYLVQKCVADDAKKPCLVLGVERRGLLCVDAARANRLLLQALTSTRAMPAGVLVCVVTRANRALVARWKSVPGSVLMQRPRWYEGLLPARTIPPPLAPSERPAR